MPVDYSKWDALELSDDSDIEVHPNVDKRSFIRAKQTQIHQERQHRKLQIETLKYERIINDGLAQRIGKLLAALRSRQAEVAESDRNPGEVAFQAVMESVGGGDPKSDRPPPPPEGVYTGEKEQPTYSKMMMTLLDQVNTALNEKDPQDRFAAMVEEIEGHRDKVVKLQGELEEKLADLEKQEGRKITSEGYREGFNSSHVYKSQQQEGESSSAGAAASSSKSESSKSQPELLNPNFNAATGSSSSSADPKDALATGGEDDEEIEASAAGKKFASIKAEDYTASARFLSQNPQILTEGETDGLLVMAFDAALEKKDDLSRQYVHQALLLQYCRSLGRDGVGLFFKRITTRGHQAQEMFYKDVSDTYTRIRTRAREIVAERANEAESGAGVEQIQLHAMEPGTVIQINIPPADSEDPEDKKARDVYEGFSAEMKKALESGSLDEVNKVLGEMSVPDAEELVSLFGEANILSMEEEIIDATTEQGQKQLKDMEREAAEEKKLEELKKAETTKYDDPE